METRQQTIERLTKEIINGILYKFDITQNQIDQIANVIDRAYMRGQLNPSGTKN